jgi:hypothetical protein
MAGTTTEGLQFEPPGPGSWEQWPVHHPRPVTSDWAEMHPAPFRAGTSNFARYYGLLVDGLQRAYVNGFGYHILLPLLGAIVTDNGGLLSHSAIVAREYGIPGVVGTREATTRIADGARVRVDGAAGEVTVL